MGSGETHNRLVTFAKEAWLVTSSIIWFFLWNLWRTKVSLIVAAVAAFFIYAAGVYHGVTGHPDKDWMAAFLLLIFALYLMYIDGWDMRRDMRFHFRKKNEQMDAAFKKKMAEIEAGKYDR